LDIGDTLNRSEHDETGAFPSHPPRPGGSAQRAAAARHPRSRVDTWLLDAAIRWPVAGSGL